MHSGKRRNGENIMLRIARIIAVAGLVGGLVSTARAELPPNFVDDFGSLAPTTKEPARSPAPDVHVAIPSNYIDDFGSLAPTTKEPARSPAPEVHVAIPSNWVDDFSSRS
jgi:hypothetical protein